MGHSEVEKIKILYEDSLKDIRNLTDRMESMTTELIATGKTLSNEKSILRLQKEKVLAGIHPAITLLEILVVGALAFSAGMFFGTKETPLLQVSIGLVLGVVIGLALCLTLIYVNNEKQSGSQDMEKVVNALHRIEKMVGSASIIWTEAEFGLVANRTVLSDCLLNACKDILVGGKSVGEAAAKHSITESLIRNKLKEFTRQK